MEIVENRDRYIANKMIALSLIFMFILLMPDFKQAFAMGSKNRPEGKGLYRYSVRELSLFLQEIGYPEYSVKWPGDITRNSDGTELRFFNGKNKKSLIVSCYGLVKEIDIPSDDVWLNDKYEVLAWLDKGKVYYKNGTSEYPPFMADERADPSGIYFMKDIASPINKDISLGTTINSIEKPDVALAKVMRLLGERIFSKDDKVFIFGNYFDTRDKQRDLYIFQKKGNDLIQIDKLIIQRPEKSPAPFNVDDFSPWTDEVLFTDVHDFGRSEWYVYNLRTHEMKKIGKVPFSGGWGFYLQCDIIKEVLEKHKK